VVSPYRDKVEIEESMDITKLATDIQETYQHRFSGRESVKVVLAVNSSWHSGHGRGENRVEGKNVINYSATLMFYDTGLAGGYSQNSFEEALQTLAETLDIV